MTDFDTNSNPIWWDLQYKGFANRKNESRMRNFEDAVFAEFDQRAPARDMMLHGPDDFFASERGSEIPTAQQSPPHNCDQQEIVEVLGWRPWSQLAGLSIQRVQGEYRVFMSRAAKTYYFPAMMLNSLWQRTMYGFDPIELLIPPRDLDLILPFSEVRRETLASGEISTDEDIWTTEGVKAALTARQRAVVAEYLALFLTWSKFCNSEFVDTGDAKHALTLRQIGRVIAWWRPS